MSTEILTKFQHVLRPAGYKNAYMNSSQRMGMEMLILETGVVEIYIINDQPLTEARATKHMLQ